MVQLSYSYMITGKITALTRWTFVGKVMSLLFKMWSRLVIAFLPRSKRFNFMAAVTICSEFGAPKSKVWHCFHCFSIYFPWSDGTGCHDVSFLNCRCLTLLTKVRLVKATVFPVVMYGCESWTVKKAKCRRIDAFELWCWRRLLRVPWTARRSNQSILK